MLLHAVALSLGAIALVQPLMLLEVVMAVAIRAALERKIPSAREFAAVGITVVGLATFLSSMSLAPGGPASWNGGRDHSAGAVARGGRVIKSWRGATRL
jgi:hypothetical protein